MRRFGGRVQWLQFRAGFSEVGSGLVERGPKAQGFCDAIRSCGSGGALSSTGCVLDTIAISLNKRNRLVAEWQENP